uniref:C2H2-type domain-containing protein n=1 Tax=Nothoprocta perdicaria TaxID=30464 RepID=A0A8C6ZJG6_NOTPE
MGHRNAPILPDIHLSIGDSSQSESQTQIAQEERKAVAGLEDIFSFLQGKKKKKSRTRDQDFSEELQFPKGSVNPEPIQLPIKEASVEDDNWEKQSPKRKQKCLQPTKEGLLENGEQIMSKKDPSTKGLPKGEWIFLCPECSKSFNQKSNLTRHRKIHTSEGPYKCSECRESFHMSRKLIRHQRKIHIRTRPCKGTKCGKCFLQKWHLIKHQLLHS